MMEKPKVDMYEIKKVSCQLTLYHKISEESIEK